MAEIERALGQAKLKVCTLADAQRFLNNAELKKDNIDRLCAWLLVLNVVTEVTPKALAKLCQEYDKLKEKLMVLPDDTQVYPGHMDTTTLSRERRFNYYMNYAANESGK